MDFLGVQRGASNSKGMRHRVLRDDILLILRMSGSRTVVLAAALTSGYASIDAVPEEKPHVGYDRPMNEDDPCPIRIVAEKLTHRPTSALHHWHVRGARGSASQDMYHGVCFGHSMLSTGQVHDSRSSQDKVRTTRRNLGW